MMIDESKIIETIQKNYLSFKRLPPHYVTRNVLMAFFDQLLFRADTSSAYNCHLFYNLELYYKKLSSEDFQKILSKINRDSVSELSFKYVQSNDLKILLCKKEISWYPFLKPKGTTYENLYFEWMMSN